MLPATSTHVGGGLVVTWRCADSPAFNQREWNAMTMMQSSKIDQFSDLLGEVRACRLGLEQRARATSRSESRAGGQRVLVEAILREYLHSRVLRERVVGYAIAAELGVPVPPPCDVGGLEKGEDALALRVLFWAAHRRMRTLALRGRKTGSLRGMGVFGPCTFQYSN